mmetsp:Transcript_11071/g.26244  ORF Transcript_11071/g.26244 Transcript_11071/m.26244 type:complete len:246 (-) Transcript_11071:1058-1795(-)
MSMPPSLSYSSSTSSSFPLYRDLLAMLRARFRSMSCAPSYRCSLTRSSRDFLSSSAKYRSLRPSEPYLSARLGMRLPSGRASAPADFLPNAPGAARPAASTSGSATASRPAGGAGLPASLARRASAADRLADPPADAFEASRGARALGPGAAPAPAGASSLSRWGLGAPPSPRSGTRPPPASLAPASAWSASAAASPGGASTAPRAEKLSRKLPSPANLLMLFATVPRSSESSEPRGAPLPAPPT